MSRPLLLIVDGESIRTPGLDSALEADGWVVQWLSSREASAFLGTALLPELLLIDPSAPGGAGYEVARTLRERRPKLPVLALSDGPFPEATEPGSTVEIQVHLDRTQRPETLADWLRRFHPAGPRLTTEDIFGDLLEDLERPGAERSLVAASIPAPLIPPVAPGSAEDVFDRGLAEVQAPALPPGTANQAAPQAEPPSMGSADPLGPSDFTLSGISGVNDPFNWGDAILPAGSGAAPRPAAPAGAPGAAEAIEEYGNYFLLEKIAVGGMAELFKAQQRGVQGFQKIVAIKRILPHFSDNEDFVTMFIDEAKLAAQLTHPNIVQIFDLGKAGTSYYIAMEYVNGRDLRTLLRKAREYGTPFPEQVAAFVVMKVAAALDYAHRKRGFDDRELKLVHRDISPQNVILSVEGAVKLVDFGIAKAASKASTTMAGALKGKLLYMSPEQAMGQPLDNRSDLYSLGLVLFELLTGERCFQADSELGVLEKVRLGRISDLTTLNPNVSREMTGIVNRALQKSVDHRYPSARFMERDLRDYLQRQGTPLTEHDVAEYMNALLKGTRETLEHLVSARFPAPASLTSGVHRIPSGDFTSSATASSHATSSKLETSTGTPLVPVPEDLATARPRWLLPVILALAVILVIMLAVAGWS
ncbi:MAG: protein kinase [Holophagaceae bacterium]|uniref:Protein kinase n=1 Tax=Candidatus Geothrix skivensis TaxID=2954439 RepID=A0A9D7SGU4_9BACT|nr:protein kinase [Candidatus Geothrix skivensis]